MSPVLLPSFLETEFYFHGYRDVKTSKLYVGLIPLRGDRCRYVRVESTPHYYFVRQYLFGEGAEPVSGYRDYEQYLEAHSLESSEEKFVRLIEDISSNGYDWENRPVFVFRHWSRFLPFGRWDVADGFHRLAVLSALGEEVIKAGILHPKRSIGSRIVRRLRK